MVNVNRWGGVFPVSKSFLGFPLGKRMFLDRETYVSDVRNVCFREGKPKKETGVRRKMKGSSMIGILSDLFVRIHFIRDSKQRLQFLKRPLIDRMDGGQ